MTQERPKWLVLFLIWLMMLVAYFDRIDVSVAGPKLMGTFHLDKTHFGVVLSAFTLGYALMQVPGGFLADRLGSKPLLVAALLLWSVFTALTGMAFSLVSLLIIRFAFGVGEGMENGAQFKLVGDNFEPKDRARANGLFLTALALGPAIGTPLSAWLMVQLGWRELFYVFAGVGLVVVILLALLLPQPPPSAPTTHGGIGEELRNPSAWLALGAYLLFNAAFWGFLQWLPTYLNTTRHLSLEKLGVLGAAPYFAGFVGLLVAGQVPTKLRAALVGCCYLAAAAFLFWAFRAEAVGNCIVALSFVGFFLYAGFGPFWAVAIGLAGPQSRGAFTGFVNFGGQVGGFCAQIFIGMLVDRYQSFDGAFLFMAGSLVLAGVAMLALQRRRALTEGP